MKGEIWFDAPQRGSWNMSMDQAMLEYASATQQVILRIYQWSQPTVSLGYFQAYEGLADYPTLSNLECVRRLTGGGAILHDQEITYSLAVPGDKHRKGHSETLYRGVHLAIASWLQSMGFPAELWEESNHESANSYPRKDAFWCFDRRSDVDVVIGSRKVLGSAQRRSAIGLLQHGGLLMESSPWLPHLEGLFLKSGKERGDENRVDFHPRRLGDVVRLAIEDALGCVWKDGEASAGVCARAKAIASERYSSSAWTQSKSR